MRNQQKNSLFTVSVLLTVVIGILISQGCSPDPDKKANDLYLKASRIMQTIKRSDMSYTEAYAMYQKAKEKVDLILSEYPSSYLAYNLRARETSIVGITLEEFRKAEKSLKRKAAAEKNPFLCALLVAESIKDDAARIIAMTAIAQGQASAGQKEKAFELLTRIVEDSDELENSGSKARALTEIARVDYKLGRMDEAGHDLSLAFKAAAAVSAPEELAVVAAAYAEFGFFSQAVDAAAGIKDDYAHVKALANIAGAYGKKGELTEAGALLSEALEINQQIQGDTQPWGLAEIAVGYAKSGEFAKALGTADAIRDSNALVWTLAELSGISAAAGEETKQNKELLRRAEESLDFSEDSPQNAWARAELATEYAAADQFAKAIDLTESITHAYSKNRAKADITGHLARTGKYTRALEIAAGINDPYFKSRALAGTGRYSADAEDFPEKEDTRILSRICRQL
jgi:tetratricopeptide (TPR) repeat protein